MNDSFLTPDVRKESFMTSGPAPDSAGRLPLPGETSVPDVPSPRAGDQSQRRRFRQRPTGRHAA